MVHKSIYSCRNLIFDYLCSTTTIISCRSFSSGHNRKLFLRNRKVENKKSYPRCFTLATTYSSVFSAVPVGNPLSHVSIIENVPPEIKIEKNGRIALDAISLADFEQYSVESLLGKFHLKGLKLPWLEKYGVSISKDRSTIFFRLQDSDGILSAVQYLILQTTSQTVTDCIFPKENNASIFGYSNAVHRNMPIVVTSSPSDAVAVNQETGFQAVSVPFQNCVFSQVANLLESYQQVILWLDASLHNWQTHKSFVEVLGEKVYFIKPADSLTTPLNGLVKGMNLKYIVSKACPIKHDSVETFSAFKDATYQEFKDYNQSSGVKWQRYPVLNDLLKGLRKGELTVFSGQTGTGKTTFMSEYSLDLCMQGVPTLWGSFEVSNIRLIKTMITQFSLCSFREFPEKFYRWASEFQKMPLFFLNFCGQHSLKDVIQAMKHTVTVYGIEHVIIDNLQFMMNSDDLNSTIDHLRRQDQLFGAFRQFATQHQCHVTLVMHPRKEPEFSELSNTSISGSAKAIQEADNILLLQTTKTRQYLQVTKNRFDGQKGCLLLEFDKKTLTYQIKRTSSVPRTQPSQELF